MLRKLILSNAVTMLAVSIGAAMPTATNFGVDDASGNPNTFVQVPVNITNAQNGPIAGIVFSISFNSGVINLTSTRVTLGDLTSAWDLSFNSTTGVVAIETGTEEASITNGTSGSVVILNFSVIGSQGAKSNINISRIQLSDINGNLGTAPAKNGTFTVASLPGATNFGVNNASGSPNTFVQVPMNITNVQNGPIISIIFSVSFNAGVINLTSTRVTRGGLTSAWDSPSYNPATGVIQITYGGSGTEIPNGASGSVVTLNFSVVGGPGTTSSMNISNIQLSDMEYNVGAAPAKNGTFTVISTPTTGTIAGYIGYSNNGTGISGVTVNLTNASGVIASTTTNASGNYNFTNVIPGSYNVTASKPMFFGNLTGVNVTPGSTSTVNLILWMKGDLNNNGIQADAGDLVLMKRASIGEITPGVSTATPAFTYDLNNNGMLADAGDLVLMKRASIGEITLL